MAEWVHVQNGVIDEYHGALPKSWRNISGLNLCDDAFLLSLGWYKVEKEYQSYDVNTQRVDGYDYQILSDRVVESLIIVNLTEEEISVLNEKNKQNFFGYLRTERNARLEKSDWTQVNDLLDIKGQEWANLWKNYRQELRELPSKYENTTNYNTSSIVWPVTPRS